MNVLLAHTTVMMMLLVPTHMAHSTVPVMLALLAMVSIAQVPINELVTSISVWVFHKSSWISIVISIWFSLQTLCLTWVSMLFERYPEPGYLYQFYHFILISFHYFGTWCHFSEDIVNYISLTTYCASSNNKWSQHQLCFCLASTLDCTLFLC